METLLISWKFISLPFWLHLSVWKSAGRKSVKLSLRNVPVGCKEGNPLSRKYILPFFKFTWALKLKVPILWPPDTKNWLIGKDPDAGKDWRQEETGVTEGEMVGRHHWFNGHELGQTPGNGKGQGGLACCSPWGHEELDTTWWLNSNNNILVHTLGHPHRLACAYLFFGADPDTDISQSMTVSELLVLRDRILRRVTNSSQKGD